MKESQSMLVSRFARLGAVVRLRQIEEEAAAIRKMFPRLAPGTAHAPAATEAQPAAKASRKGRGMSPEAREAARARMQAYWARKRQEGPPAGGKVEASERPARAAARRRGRKTARKRSR